MEAAHRRVARDLADQIAAGLWAPGDQLPSRASLARHYGVHEQTVRLAMALLRSRGLIEGEQRNRLYVAHPPVMRTLIAPDRDWPHQTEQIAGGTWKAGEQLAARLDVPLGTTLHHEALECLDPGGRSALIACTWWRGKRRPHASYAAEIEVMQLDEPQAHALGLTVDTLAYRVMRTRLDAAGQPTETADLILPMDRWTIRL
ncbi:GntR family transcriptional regulator [Streptomyces kronopolitis]|uniref:GntR family transcriptional regulator n=1 Tax=Streptomyces kronopolitis TaxID=1612435 RepID=UPI0034356420